MINTSDSVCDGMAASDRRTQFISGGGMKPPAFSVFSFCLRRHRRPHRAAEHRTCICHKV